jgi:hypothetical protein
VADGLVMSTGAVLDRDIVEVVSKTRDAVDLVRLPSVDDGSEAGRRLRELAETGSLGTTGRDEEASGETASGSRASVLVGEDFEPVALPPRFVLSGRDEQIAKMLDANPGARWLIVAGALPDGFLRSLLHPLHRHRRELVLVVTDPTRVFLSERGPAWYRRQGVHLQTVNGIDLEALTVNPVAPQSHRFDSAQLRALMEEAIPDVPVFDVLSETYAQTSRFVSS